ncbi:hypothetical protein ASZ90_011778 [hydrocarbon metagenome]|uniref:Uncharacterized protein n=1 Tax=hydrocarbon metagenome TaxID=938273 RepID=A0A0W8FCS2_9ZZZZ
MGVSIPLPVETVPIYPCDAAPERRISKTKIAIGIPFKYNCIHHSSFFSTDDTAIK